MKQAIKFLLWILVFQVIGLMMGYLTGRGIEPWYHDLTKSSLTPEPIVFSIVWPILYVLLAVCAKLLWDRRDHDAIKPAVYLYAIQLLVNWSWTPLFFSLHLLGVSFAWIILLIILTMLTMIKVWHGLRLVAILLLPYLLWLCFAAYLNGYIFMHN